MSTDKVILSYRGKRIKINADVLDGILLHAYSATSDLLFRVGNRPGDYPANAVPVLSEENKVALDLLEFLNVEGPK